MVQRKNLTKLWIEGSCTSSRLTRGHCVVSSGKTLYSLFSTGLTLRTSEKIQDMTAKLLTGT